MIIETIYLPVAYEGILDNGGFKPSLKAYIPDVYEDVHPSKKRPTVVIFPGGGYSHHSVREAEPIALAFNRMGFNACVLTYSVAPMEFPVALLDACQGLHTLCEYQEKWNIDMQNVFLCGFSAGSHLAASVGIYGKTELVSQYFKDDLPAIRGLILSYPVISSGDFAHKGSVENVLGEKILNSDKAQYYKDLISLEKNVHGEVPPVFMWHTNEDTSVPAENSLLFALALRKHNIPVEYHLFEKGIHGIALANNETSFADGRHIQQENQSWIRMCETWMHNHLLTI
ncbi:MAG: alpha/beta hydrolase [Spirochaetaceae bacterium]|nr:alpha/beta hydrolase [Spirochaetaceae bacterium]